MEPELRLFRLSRLGHSEGALCFDSRGYGYLQYGLFKRPWFPALAVNQRGIHHESG